MLISLCVVIPALDEERVLPRLLEVVVRESVPAIVVDGGSGDATLEVARSFPGVEVAAGRPPRASQMNLGAARAGGDALLFLHADAVPPAGFAARVADALADPRVVGGAFDLEIDAPGVAARLISRGASLRSRLTRSPYGDQGIFVRRGVFDAMGGYAPLPFLEDLDFTHRLHCRGRVVLLRQRMRVSARRWEASGYLRTTVRNAVLAGCFYLGVDTAPLARWVGPIRG